MCRYINHHVSKILYLLTEAQTKRVCKLYVVFFSYMSVARLTKKQRVSNDRLGKRNSRKSLDINTIKSF